MDLELENPGVNLRGVLIEYFGAKDFLLITQFKPTVNRQIIQEEWLLKTRNHFRNWRKSLSQAVKYSESIAELKTKMKNLVNIDCSYSLCR